MTFEELGLAEPILRALTSEGYTSPTPIQEQSIPHTMTGRDLLGCAQTGTGKTAAFALPVLHRLTLAAPAKGRGRRIRVLVLSPTRELAAQIGDSFFAYGKNTTLKHTCVFGGVSQQPQTKALQHGVDVLIATPGRLCDLMDQGFIDLTAVETFVLDEADRMLDMGFMPDLKRIIDKLPAKRQTLMFSATMPEAIAKLADTILVNPISVKIAPVQSTTDLIEQSVCFVPKPNKCRALADLLCSSVVTRALVFTRTKHGADRVVKNLLQAGIRAEAMHGNKTQSARQRTLANFKANRTMVLVATDLAARGIDVDNISHVVQYDLPTEAETYVHRIGRTGRAGSAGIAISFCDHEERKQLKAIERLIRRPLPVEKLERSNAAPRPPITDAPVVESLPHVAVDLDESESGEAKPERTHGGWKGARKPAHRTSTGHGGGGGARPQHARSGQGRPSTGRPGTGRPGGTPRPSAGSTGASRSGQARPAAQGGSSAGSSSGSGQGRPARAKHGNRGRAPAKRT